MSNGADAVAKLREKIAAGLAFLILIAAVVLLIVTMALSQTNTTATNLISTLFGWGGVVVGFYFGGKSGESQAAKSQENATKAEATSVKTQALLASVVHEAAAKEQTGDALVAARQHLVDAGLM